MTAFQALRPLGLSAFGILLSLSASAQISVPGQPLSGRVALSDAVPVAVLEAPDVAALQAQDLINGPLPLRYGEVLTTSLGVDRSGLWEEVPQAGSLVWRQGISAPGALSLGVVFTDFWLPPGGALFLYNDAGDVVGAYTEANNNPDAVLGIQPLAGESLTIEYVQPAEANAAPRLEVGEVIYDYRDVFQLLESSADSDTTPEVGPADGSCGLIGINCPEGANYQQVKRSVMRTLVGGGLCSAALLNNTAEDGTPYMLTAEHCGLMTAGVFTFNYEQATCGVAFGPLSQTLSGAQQLAASAAYDSQLYRLNTTPPASYNVHYAGWDRTTSTGGPVATIGHGNGGPKNIAIDNNGALIAGSDWQATWSSGYIEGGNSGGPLFNANMRVVGPACCVNFFICGIQTAWFGRFDLFYNNGSLSQWLDPLGTGQFTLDGTDNPSGAPATLAINSITPGVIDALNVGTDQLVTIDGSGFLPTTTVEVNGTPLFDIPSPYTYVDSNTITFDPPDAPLLGLAVVTVKNGSTSASQLVTFVHNTEPALQAANGEDPVTVLTAGGLPLKCAGTPGDTFLVLSSLSNLPSSVPGLFDVGIGNGLTSLFLIGQVVIEADGVTDLNIPLVNIPPVTTFFVEGLTIDGAFSLPLPDSNTQEVFVLF